MTAHPLLDLPRQFHRGARAGITSVCSAHPVVIAAALRHGLQRDQPVLIEATCNQVNQDGGYTGMTPAGFRRFVEGIANGLGFPLERLILGGDHLGPNPWRHLAPEQAMAKAAVMIAAFAAAGFSKLHLDCSMGCAGEPVALPDALTAARAAQLAAVAEHHWQGRYDPVYVIGTEVPVPGGAVEALEHLQITRPEAVAATYGVHRNAFAAAGQTQAFARVVALVVQPGVEFGHDAVIAYAPEAAQALSGALRTLPGLVFEAHSTDYQSAEALCALVSGGFAILKVGPWLTFALRETLYGLDAIADALDGGPPRHRLMAGMEAAMQAAPEHWAKYYHGSAPQLWLQRHFSYSDRIRYYWPDRSVAAGVAALRARLAGRRIPAPVLEQYLPRLCSEDASFDGLLDGAVQSVLALYQRAIEG